MKKKISLKSMQGTLSREEMKQINGGTDDSVDPGDGAGCLIPYKTCNSSKAYECCSRICVGGGLNYCL